MSAATRIQLSILQVTRCKKLQVTNFTPKRALHVPKKIYKNVSIVQSNGLYEINLDNLKLKTPQGKVFQVPNESLAVAVATEWDSQDKLIRRENMHLTALCNTAQDNPLGRTKESLAQIIVEFLETDTICCRQDEPIELTELQQNEWNPVLEWFCKRYDVVMNVSTNISGPEVSSRTKDIVMRHLLSHNFFALTGMHFAVEALKSVTLMLAIVDRHVSVEKAVSLSRLELEYQISKWGNVEWAHDVDLMDLRSRVSAAILFTLLNNELSIFKKKAAH